MALAEAPAFCSSLRFSAGQAGEGRRRRGAGGGRELACDGEGAHHLVGLQGGRRRRQTERVISAAGCASGG